eukprot:TRINITY_DN39801_c0_g1_i1.p1 TRINITY_DN39801_c0_g1~~TRINITY_DN39801_c0_g1_i1.p1  ORF type:complete len:161 (-),score=14.00 TRINITY_DN39801_c0_g1_i1:79-561(-)
MELRSVLLRSGVKPPLLLVLVMLSKPTMFVMAFISLSVILACNCYRIKSEEEGILTSSKGIVSITVELGEGKALGIKVGCKEEYPYSCEITRVYPDGDIPEWNAQHAEDSLNRYRTKVLIGGDWIMEVNGQKTVLAELIRYKNGDNRVNITLGVAYEDVL